MINDAGHALNAGSVQSAAWYNLGVLYRNRQGTAAQPVVQPSVEQAVQSAQ